MPKRLSLLTSDVGLVLFGPEGMSRLVKGDSQTEARDLKEQQPGKDVVIL
jgi:hypothetical protein